ncbi:helix-turn-helix transcriptional regulator [Phytomonospora endophytica]|uniref:DNA-binding NarL/FixJ family response regulator n=1 Tax=Phytomonospora endophytica TaxID=714109 RepID=A0A841G0K2_9ACTN|nr:LuxR C-terminal-related transcriptional regulator [Phytomonospora endophytica]MBB6038209.1 DNA-binding NarL/FixJ family response regulator [Phytomonospora endophytica]GIG67333.1 hypothetical protein Pen01_36280 [Phytomonospora endophytica]
MNHPIPATAHPTTSAPDSASSSPTRFPNRRIQVLAEHWTHVATHATRVANGYAAARLHPNDLQALRSALTAAFQLQAGMRSASTQALEPNAKSPLTERQQEILVELSQGRTMPEIASRLFVSTDTVKTHLRRIYRVLGAANGSNAVFIAMRAGILQ